MAKQELLATIRDRYRASSKKDKSRILDEFIAVTGHHRKHGIRLLGKLDDDEGTTHSVRGRRIYDEAVREAVIVIGPSRRAAHGAPLQGVASVRELLPALVQADRQDSGRRYHRQALQPTYHALRPADPA